MTLAQLKKLTSTWQKKLRLQNWEINVSWMPQSEEEGEMYFANGYCQWSEQHKLARIVISRNAENIKHTVVHELLHLLWEGNLPQVKAVKGDPTSKEFAINTMADVLIGRK